MRDSDAADAPPAVHFIHQDAVLKGPFVGPLRVIAELVEAPPANMHCGTFHFATVATYRVVEVQEGEYSSPDLLVFHGCPELARAKYDVNAGDLRTFKVGARHLLTLSAHAPLDDVSLVDTPAHPELHRYWAQRTDLAPAVP